MVRPAGERAERRVDAIPVRAEDELAVELRKAAAVRVRRKRHGEGVRWEEGRSRVVGVVMVA